MRIDVELRLDLDVRGIVGVLRDRAWRDVRARLRELRLERGDRAFEVSSRPGCSGEYFSRAAPSSPRAVVELPQQVVAIVPRAAAVVLRLQSRRSRASAARCPDDPAAYSARALASSDLSERSRSLGREDAFAGIAETSPNWA